MCGAYQRLRLRARARVCVCVCVCVCVLPYQRLVHCLGIAEHRAAQFAPAPTNASLSLYTSQILYVLIDAQIVWGR
eukprot:COSAG03_NODE_9673_length_701_cov_1.098007_2_plen_76_part_00